MKACRVGDRLDVFRRSEITIMSGNCRKPPFQQTRNGWRKGVTEVRVLGAAAVLRPITGVHCELHEIGESSDILSTSRFTTRQGAKLIQIDWICALGNQVRIDEGEVSKFIFGIIVNILGHVPIQLSEGINICFTAAPAWYFAVLDTSQFIVLLPKVSFKNFGCRQEPKNGYISFCEISASFFGEDG